MSGPSVGPSAGPSAGPRGQIYRTAGGELFEDGWYGGIRRYLDRGRRHFDRIVVSRQRLARLILVAAALISVVVVAASLVIRAASPETGSAITGAVANRVPIWAYPPNNSAASDAPVITPDPIESPDQPEIPPVPQTPQRGTLPEPAAPPASSSPSPKPTPTPTSLRAGTERSLRLASATDRYIRYRDGFAFLDPIAQTSSAATRTQATFTVVTGLSSRDCYSFRGADGRYLRHHGFRIRYDTDDGSRLFREDATFCVRSFGRGGSSFALESENYRDRYIRNRGGELWLDPRQFSPEYVASTQFQATSPWS